MLLFGLIFICGIFYLTAIEIKVSKLKTTGKGNSRTVDTVLQLDNDNSEDLKVLNKAHKPIGKIKTVIEKKKPLRNQFSSDLDKRATFTDFVQKVLKTLTKFNDDDLKYFVTVLSDEITKYHYRGCKFYELTENYKFRRFFAHKLDEIKSMTAVELRNNLKAIREKIEKEKYKLKEKELVDLINSMYSPDSIAEFQNMLIKINDYKNSPKANLVKIVSEGLRMIFFDHYTRLDNSARLTLKSKIVDFFNASLINEISKVKPELKAVSKGDKIHSAYNRYVNYWTEDKIIKYPVRTNNLDHYDYRLQNGTTQKIVIKHFMPIKIHKRTTNKKGTKLTFKTLYPEFEPEWSGHNIHLIKKGYPRIMNTNWPFSRRVNEITHDDKPARQTKTFSGIETQTTSPVINVNNRTYNFISPTRSSPSFGFKTRNSYQKTHFNSVEARGQKEKEIKQVIAAVQSIRLKNETESSTIMTKLEKKLKTEFKKVKSVFEKNLLQNDLSSQKTKIIDKNKSAKVKSVLNQNGKHLRNSIEDENVTNKLWKPNNRTINNENNKINRRSEDNFQKTSESVNSITTHAETTEKTITTIAVSRKSTDSLTIATNSTES